MKKRRPARGAAGGETKAVAVLAMVGAVMVSGLSAAEPKVDKSRYSFAEPVPAAEMREMTTDRPDATESPFTVDPGHVQLEMDFANYGRDREGGERVTEWEAAPFNLRFGVTANLEAGIFVVPYRSVTESTGGPRRRTTGFGDVTLRGKWNLQGNDGGDTAFGLMADVKVPTGSGALSNDKWEGALTLPVAFPLAAGWAGAAMTTVEARYSDGGDYRLVWSNTITAGRDLTENTGVFVELTSSAGDGSHVATFNCGMTRRVGPNLQFDAGVNFGLSSAAADFAVFAGMARRF